MATLNINLFWYATQTKSVVLTSSTLSPFLTLLLEDYMLRINRVYLCNYKLYCMCIILVSQQR